jgi:hypothetical protein
MLDIISFLWNYWFLIVWALAVLVGQALGGWRLALAVACFGIAPWAYHTGKKDGKAGYEEKAKEIQVKREQAYAEIDKRRYTGSDVTNRLRDGKW